MDKEIKDSLTASQTWMRGLYMVLFAVIYSVAEVVLGAVVVLQFILMLLTGTTNRRLLEFGDDLSVFIYQILQFQTFNTESKPFPFAAWPYGEAGPDAADVEVVEVTEDEVAEAGDIEAGNFEAGSAEAEDTASDEPATGTDVVDDADGTGEKKED